MKIKNKYFEFIGTNLTVDFYEHIFILIKGIKGVTITNIDDDSQVIDFYICENNLDYIESLIEIMYLSGMDCLYFNEKK